MSPRFWIGLLVLVMATGTGLVIGHILRMAFH